MIDKWRARRILKYVNTVVSVLTNAIQKDLVYFQQFYVISFKGFIVLGRVE